MTIEAWNIVISAAILGLLAGGGIWLKYVVDQQLKTKDTTIEALKGVVQLKDAHIASLEGNTAPAIAKAYADMRQHANLMTEESQNLSVQLGEVTKKQQEAEKLLLPRILIGEVNALDMVSGLLEENVWKLLFHNGQIEPKFATDFSTVLDGLLTTSKQINLEKKTRLRKGRDVMKMLESNVGMDKKS